MNLLALQRPRLIRAKEKFGTVDSILVSCICSKKQTKQNAMTDLKTTLGLRHNIDQLSTLENAKRWAGFCVKPHAVLLGDNGKYWVACFADAQKLVNMGYEIAK